ncbi:hypothetical protein N7491_007002 [Penicillium cf. griseofulvum]|uniref:Uncharacterized protein n=1 Tax=Penicillium cf. griseofulvum TaxID=2972120 RepID=A0A9W9M0M1_9EURO|nr:hypothetical protein N7472_009966 [Penicillium cf. griseofulvum]KAJ5429986.1 hypothetical protein N7491_007002 [Penicillium cf. griseofulvum]KAJ5436239.1 hypothetical protein N7445_007124 [Penicillium cf. griseofulvum]
MVRYHSKRKRVDLDEGSSKRLMATITPTTSPTEHVRKSMEGYAGSILALCDAIDRIATKATQITMLREASCSNLRWGKHIQQMQYDLALCQAAYDQQYVEINNQIDMVDIDCIKSALLLALHKST